MIAKYLKFVKYWLKKSLCNGFRLVRANTLSNLRPNNYHYFYTQFLLFYFLYTILYYTQPFFLGRRADIFHPIMLPKWHQFEISEWIWGIVFIIRIWPKKCTYNIYLTLVGEEEVNTQMAWLISIALQPQLKKPGHPMLMIEFAVLANYSYMFCLSSRKLFKVCINR